MHPRSIVGAAGSWRGHNWLFRTARVLLRHPVLVRGGSLREAPLMLPGGGVPITDCANDVLLCIGSTRTILQRCAAILEVAEARRVTAPCLLSCPALVAAESSSRTAGTEPVNTAEV